MALVLVVIAIIAYPILSMGVLASIIVLGLCLKYFKQTLLLALLIRPLLDFELIRQYVFTLPGISVELDAAGVLNY